MRLNVPSLIPRIRTLLLIVVFIITSDAMAATISSVGTGNWSATAWPNTARTGTITTSNASATVTGAGGSLFLSEISVGNIIKTAANVVIGTVLSVSNNTTLILTGNAASTNAGIAYHVQGIGSGDIAQISGANTITVDIASAACVSFQSNPAAPFTPATLVFNLNSHLTVSGLVTVGDLSGHALSIDMTNGGIVTCHGFTFDNAGAWTPGAGTVEFTATTTLPAGPFVLNNLTISGGTTTTAATLTINGNLSIADGATFSAGGFALTVSGTTTVGGGTSGNLTVSAAAGVKSFNGLVTINAGGTWNNSGNSTITFHGGITNNGTFTSGTGVQTFNTNAQALSGIFSIPSITVTGFTLNNNNTLTVTTALIGTGTLAQAANATLNINFTGAPGITGLTATANGNIVDYGFAGTQTVFSANYYHLLLSNTSAKTLQAGTTTISGNFTLSGTASATAVIGLTIAGNITIGLGTTFDAGAFTHNIAGNWSRTGTFTPSTSTVIFNGAALQTITATGGENFENLTINNSGTGIQLANFVTIAVGLTMTLGNIDLNGNNLNLGISAVSIGTLVRTVGTIFGTGSIKRWFNTTAIGAGSAAGLYPTGTAVDYNPFYISTSVAPTSSGTIKITYVSATTNTIVSFPDGASTVAVRKDLNWAVTTANGFAGGTYNLDIRGTGFGSIGNVNDLRIVLVNSVVGLSAANAGTILNPQINRTGLSALNLVNTFYVGSVNFANTNLPITLISFTASVLDKQVELDWSTSSEINNDYFTVQRTKDAGIWESIQRISGAGNSKTISSYTVFDQNPDPGKSYYRLMQTDFDGKQTYSAIRSVNRENALSAISIYPNPASDNIRISFPSAGLYEVSLFNGNGQMLILPVVSGGAYLVLNVSNMQAGFYFIHINHGTVQEIRKIIISK